MQTLYYYYHSIVKQDLLTKFNYANVAQIPRLKKIELSFKVSQSSLRHLLPLISALTLISSQKPSLLTSKKANLTLKLKKGLPVGCQVSLRKEVKYFFLERLIFSVFPQIKDFSLPFLKVGEKNVFLILDNLFYFKEIEKEYENFQDLPPLSINFVFEAKNKKEVFAFLSALKFPIKKN